MSDIVLSSIAVDELPTAEVIDSARRTVGLDADARLWRHERLKKQVHRLCFEVGGRSTSLVVKRMLPARARAVQLVAERWLPAGGLAWACPGLLGVIREPEKRAVWHLYEDVRGNQLDCRSPDHARVELVVELIAELHASFTGHALLEECRAVGGDLGMGFFASQVAASIGHLSSLASDPSPGDVQLTHRLLDRMQRLYDQREERGRLLAASGDDETLLHGDLWTSNTVITERGDRPLARLIDWDHAGVGPVAYDLSTFLFRFPPEHRAWIVDRYRDAARRRGRRLPDARILHRLFETAEFARYACCLSEAASAAVSRKRWGFEQMVEIEGWFRAWNCSVPPAATR